MSRATIFAAVALLSPPAVAGPCDALGHAIAARTKAAIEEITPEFGNVRFSHSAAHEMTLVCGPGDARSLFVAYEGDPPDVRFLALASVAGGICSAGRQSRRERLGIAFSPQRSTRQASPREKPARRISNARQTPLTRLAT